jgi:PAS domain-containing protein
MAHKEIEIILSRHLASYLATPIFIVDPAGNLLYYNEHAEAILGSRFNETGEMPVSEWSEIFKPMDSEGMPLLAENLPLVQTLRSKTPNHGGFWIRGLDNVLRRIEVFAFPIVGQTNRYLGAVAIFWETDGT